MPAGTPGHVWGPSSEAATAAVPAAVPAGLRDDVAGGRAGTQTPGTVSSDVAPVRVYLLKMWYVFQKF